MCGCQHLGACRIQIAADGQSGAGQRSSALRADQTAADDSDIEGHPDYTC
jgi:hypothetical protein